MLTRVGKVTNIYPNTGKVKVMYEDSKSSSLPLAMLTMNGEYSMPNTGDKVVTLHLENGSSKGFVLGTYYGSGTPPKAKAGYRKDFGEKVYVTCNEGSYVLKGEEIVLDAESVVLQCSYGTVTLKELLKRMERIEEHLSLQHMV